MSVGPVGAADHASLMGLIPLLAVQATDYRYNNAYKKLPAFIFSYGDAFDRQRRIRRLGSPVPLGCHVHQYRTDLCGCDCLTRALSPVNGFLLIFVSFLSKVAAALKNNQ